MLTGYINKYLGERGDLDMGMSQTNDVCNYRNNRRKDKVDKLLFDYNKKNA